MTLSLKELDVFIEQSREEMLDLLAALIAVDTTNPPGNEKAAAEVVADYLDRRGIEYEIFARDPMRTNIVATAGSEGPTIFVPAHLDVVPAGDGWKTNPFELVIDGDRLIGRGVTDNKGQLVSALLALTFLKERENELPVRFQVAAVADEERGSTFGLEYLVEEKLVRADYAIVPDCGGNMREIDVAEKGALFFEIQSHGKQVHGSAPEKGVNAVMNMAELLTKLRGYRPGVREHPLLSPPTVNVGSVHGGSAPNMVPSECTAAVDVRYLPGDSAESILSDVRSLAQAVRAEFPDARFDFEIKQDMPPCEVPLPNPLIDAIQAATREALGAEAQPIGLSGTTVIKQLLKSGVCAVGFGPGDADQPHTPNESVSLTELLDFARVLVLIAEKVGTFAR